MKATPSPENIFSEYLKLKLLNIKDDQHLAKLKLASTDLSAELRKDHRLLRVAALVAFDPNIGADNEMINSTQDVITKHWETFAANTKTKAVTVIRAVMLVAIKSLSAEEKFAAIIWSSLRDILPCYQLGQEKTYLTQWVASLGDQIEAKTVQNWSMPSNPKLKESGSVLISQETQKIIETGNQLQTESIAAINESFKTIITEIQENQTFLAKQMHLMQLRNQLLWWKASGFSTSVSKPYDELKPVVLSIAMAVDYAVFFNEMFPESANYFLSRMHAGFCPEGAKPQTMSEILSGLDGHGDVMRTLLPYDSSTSEIKTRLTLHEFIAGYVNGVYDKKVFVKRVGFSFDMKISQNHFCLWLFHDLFTAKLCNQ